MPPSPFIRRVRFDVRPWGSAVDPARELVPYVDNVSLVDFVRGYELAAGFDVPGAYAGIVLDHFRFGDLTAYLTGEPESAYRTRRGVVALLGCDCGEVGCWPLEVGIVRSYSRVTWRGFAQPFRPNRDYGGFGPFVFDRAQYERAASAAAIAASAVREPG